MRGSWIVGILAVLALTVLIYAWIDGGREPLRWNGHHLIGTDRPDARDIEVVVLVGDDRLALSFDWSP